MSGLTIHDGFEWTDPHGDNGAHFALPADDAGAAELMVWWHQIAHNDALATLPKAIEYSAHDLELTGQLFEFLLGPVDRPVDQAELTCWFYLASKVMRAIGALKDGQTPSADTLRDIRVYAMMITRIRARGAWPEMMRP